MITTLHQRLSR